MYCSILTTNINKNDEEEKKCQIFASAMYSSYQASVSPEGGLEVGQTLWFFQKPLACKQALLFGRVKRVSRERASVPRSRVFARLTRRASSQAKKPFARKLIYSGAKWSSCGHTTDFYLGKPFLPRANSSKIYLGKFIWGFVLPR